MSTAICAACGHEVRWSATRGTRLADLRCPGCGGVLHAPTAGRPSATLGQRFARCAYCGRRRLERAMVTLNAPTWLIGREMPAGAVVCRWHEVAEAGGAAYLQRPGGFVSIGSYHRTAVIG